MQALERDVARYHDPRPLSRLTMSLGPTTPTYARPDVMKGIAAIAKGGGLGLHTHFHPRPGERELVRQLLGMTPMEFLGEMGWLHERTFLAHCTQLDDEEITQFAWHGVAVVHCPHTILRLGYPMTRIAQLRRAQVRIGLGVDGSASNDGGSFIGEMRLALLLHRVNGDCRDDPESDWMLPDEVLYMATRQAAGILGRSDIGHLAPGMAADLNAFDLERVARAGATDPLGAVLFAGNDGPASLTMVGGRVLVRQGDLAIADEREISRAANVRAAGLLERSSKQS
ncbi:amidohydrolase family protein [Ramlibacter sp.]|uniref:amidohydrolase family protein n=1 Tax=Ramlibacter sp. TaxID=1917967 RepID=UPI002FC7FBAB